MGYEKATYKNAQAPVCEIAPKPLSGLREDLSWDCRVTPVLPVLSAVEGSEVEGLRSRIRGSLLSSYR